MPLSYQRKSPRIHIVSRYLNRQGDKHSDRQPFLRGQGKWPQRHMHVKEVTDRAPCNDQQHGLC